mmetsp:Transcript_20639/g.50883  ORF Transcript_20639/g.50883 Transcript_20639/m.50883 type:complete len:255 (+) Transcript_20639:417-1181(+)
MGCPRMVEEYCEKVRGERDLGKCAEFLLHGRPDLLWFAPLHPDILASSREFVWTHAKHFVSTSYGIFIFSSFFKPVGDMLFVIPGKLARTFYYGIDQTMFPKCCECKEKRPSCIYLPEPNLAQFFAGMRLLQIDVLPFPFAVSRPPGDKKPIGTECFRWKPPYYQEARLFKDTFPFTACLRAAPILSPEITVSPGSMKVNKTEAYESHARLVSHVRGPCVDPSNPYLQGKTYPLEGHKVLYQDFRNYASSWLHY